MIPHSTITVSNAHGIKAMVARIIGISDYKDTVYHHCIEIPQINEEGTTDN
jgi:hypothetical protein